MCSVLVVHFIIALIRDATLFDDLLFFIDPSTDANDTLSFSTLCVFVVK